MRAWVEVARRRSRIVSAAGGESLSSGKLRADITHVVTLRAVAGVTSAMRVKWLATGRVFEIIEAKYDATFGRDLVLKCVENGD